MTFFNDVMRKICKYHTVSYDDRTYIWEDACHYKPNIPKGDSWGSCEPSNCPFLKKISLGLVTDEK